jgi:ABC-2 type transport system ATP-binding protein
VIETPSLRRGDAVVEHEGKERPTEGAATIERAPRPQASGAQPPMLAVHDLHKTVAVGFLRRKVEILKGVNLQVQPGDIFGLLGPNGAGKTTTVKIIVGLMKPTSGSVTLGVDGRQQLGYLPENPYFYDYLSGREFLSLCARLFGIAAAARDDLVARLLRDVGLESAATVHLRKYSKGMLQRIGIAQALINDPQVVFLDEPMTGLDPLGRVEVKHIIEGLRERGKTVLFNSHILADVGELCSRIAIMAGGRVIWQGDVAEALDDTPQGLEAFFLKMVSQ